MATVYLHRRRKNGQKLKAKPVEAYYAAGASIFSLLIYGVIIAFSIYSAGENPNWLGGVGFLGFCVAIGAFGYNVTQMHTQTELKERIICLIISSVALVIWLGTYVIGMVQ